MNICHLNFHLLSNFSVFWRKTSQINFWLYVALLWYSFWGQSITSYGQKGRELKDTFLLNWSVPGVHYESHLLISLTETSFYSFFPLSVSNTALTAKGGLTGSYSGSQITNGRVNYVFIAVMMHRPEEHSPAFRPQVAFTVLAARRHKWGILQWKENGTPALWVPTFRADTT